MIRWLTHNRFHNYDQNDYFIFRCKVHYHSKPRHLQLCIILINVVLLIQERLCHQLREILVYFWINWIDHVFGIYKFLSCFVLAFVIVILVVYGQYYAHCVFEFNAKILKMSCKKSDRENNATNSVNSDEIDVDLCAVPFLNICISISFFTSFIKRSYLYSVRGIVLPYDMIYQP